MRIPAVLAIALWSLAAFAQIAAKEIRVPSMLTPERAVRFRRISSLAFSADASHLVCVVSEVKGQFPEAHLWMLDVPSKNFFQLTFSSKSENSPRWSPDGRSIAFLSNRGQEMQVYVMRIDGGEARPVTVSKHGVSDFRWSPDGGSIAFLAPEETESERSPGDDAQVADREQDLDRLWVIDVATQHARQVTAGAWMISEFEWATEGRILAIASHQPKAETWNAELYSISVSDGTFSPFSKPNQPFAGLAVSPQRSRLSFVATRGGGPIPHDFFLQDFAGTQARDTTASLDRAVVETKWQSESTVFLRAVDGFQNRIYKVAGDEIESIALPYSVRAFDVARDGTIAFVGVAFNHLPELFLRRASGAVEQVSHVQEGWEGIHLSDAEVFRFKSFDGTTIEAALMKPAIAPPGRKPPLILLAHGGPASNFSSDYFWFNAWPQLLVASGYQALLVNPRGSSGYGEAFLKANRGDWGGGDFKDLMAALDTVIARGEVDPSRLGIGGWSYGAEMTEWAITQTNRFRAAVAGGGVFDQAAEFETEDSPAGDEWYFGTPWDHPDVFARNSPATYISKVRTPLLIVHGESDHNNPVAQSKALYRALKHYGVETELVVYPREGHLPREEKHQIDVLERMLAWFNRYLPPAVDPTPHP